MATIDKITQSNFTPNPATETPFPVYSHQYNKAVDQINTNTTTVATNTAAKVAGTLFTQVASTTPAATHTINAACGRCIVTHGSTAGLATLTVTINNSLVTATSIVFASIGTYGGTGTPLVGDVTPGAGTITIEIYNAHATTALSANFGLSFVVLG
jgi:hypothetical protein